MKLVEAKRQLNEEGKKAKKAFDEQVELMRKRHAKEIQRGPRARGEHREAGEAREGKSRKRWANLKRSCCKSKMLPKSRPLWQKRKSSCDRNCCRPAGGGSTHAALSQADARPGAKS